MSQPIVADGSALRLLALTDSLKLLRRTDRGVRQPVVTSRFTLDPDLIDSETALPEITQSLNYHRRIRDDPSRPERFRRQAGRHVGRLETLMEMCDSGLIRVVDMDGAEMSLFASLASDRSCRDYGLPFPLCLSSASCVAIATAREMALLTDDEDARTVATHVDVPRLLALDDLRPA